MRFQIYFVVILIVLFIGSVAFWLQGRVGTLETDDFAQDVIEVFDDTVSADEELDDEVEAVGEVRVTGGVRHSVPLDQIIGGGPAKDGIPSIDDPVFVNISNADFLDDSDPGIVVEINGDARFYSYDVLVWHEIVNDRFNGKRVLITYCPLCASGIVYDPVVDGERVEFGTSGKLWQSNLVMYDRKTDSYWSQVLGEAIQGEMTGARLSVLPSDIASFGSFKKIYPNGRVLSRDTGYVRLYGYDPYASQGYHEDNNAIFTPVRATDSRLENKQLVFGIVLNDVPKAYDVSYVESEGVVRDEFQGKTIELVYEEDLGTVRMYEIGEGARAQINPVPTYWFSWVAAYPDTHILTR